MWKNMVERGRRADVDITRHMRFEFWITTAMLLLGKKLLLECASIVHTYIASFVCKWLSTFEIRWLFVCIRHHCQACYIPRYPILPDLLVLTVCGPTAVTIKFIVMQR
jgi:hypothetical protein